MPKGIDGDLARPPCFIKEAKVDDLLRYQGWLKIFRKASSFEKFKAEMKIMDDAASVTAFMTARKSVNWSRG